LWLARSYPQCAQVVTIASTIVAARVFKSRDLEEGEFNPPDVFFTAVWVASAASLAAFLGILLLMKSKYRGSFLSIETGAQSVQNNFISSDSDGERGGRRVGGGGRGG
jgi:hypothetical protein